MVQASCGSWSHTLRATTGSRRSGRGSTMTASPATAAYAGAGGMGGGGLSRHEPLHLSRSTGHRSWAMLRQARLLKSSAMKGQAPAWPVPPGALRARHGGLACSMVLYCTVVGATTAHARARRAGLFGARRRSSAPLTSQKIAARPRQRPRNPPQHLAAAASGCAPPSSCCSPSQRVRCAPCASRRRERPWWAAGARRRRRCARCARRSRRWTRRRASR